MTLQQLHDKNKKEFEEKFNSLGYDHKDTCTCGFLEACHCISGRKQLIFFLTQKVEEAYEIGKKESKAIGKNIFITEVDWAEWAVSDEEAGEIFEQEYGKLQDTIK